MCGITGFVQPNSHYEAMQIALQRMTRALAHRGPDGEGLWLEEHSGVGLGHRRLAIIDLSPTGYQPMCSPGNRYVITFNGEIYNYRTLREQLPHVSWRGTSDTEVMLAAFEHWGIEEALRRIVGMFAFALWDQQEHALYLGRDRFGEKPLYYGWVDQAFLFGSELKALWAHPLWQREIDRNALALFLRYNYVPTPYSIYQGIFKLPPATFLKLDHTALAHRTLPQPTAYWNLQEILLQGHQKPFQGDDTEAAETLELLLRQSLTGQMIADVPLGAFLSGGIDSSVIVALMQAQSSLPIKTFSIGFEEQEFNEAPYAKRVSQHLGTDHTEYYVTLREALEVIPKLPTLFDEPFSDSSQIPTYLVAQIARRNVTVSLSGDAGDELFIGYQRYFDAEGTYRYFHHIPKSLQRGIKAAIGSLSARQWRQALDVFAPVLPASLRSHDTADKLQRLAYMLPIHSKEAFYLDVMSHWNIPQNVVLGAQHSFSLFPDFKGFEAPFLHHMSHFDLASYLPEDILVKVDRAAMGVSLETRVPFLDHRVVEFVCSLPYRFKVRAGQGKWLLRQVLYKYVPPNLIDRPKMGFGVPLRTWLRGDLRDWSEALLDTRRLKEEGFFDPAPIRARWEAHLSGEEYWHYHLWDILMFQAWYAETQTHYNPSV